MKLNDFNFNKIETTTKALKEHYEIPFNIKKLDKMDTHQMLLKIRGLLSETRKSPNFYYISTSPSYMKLVFMEQALSDRFKQLLTKQVKIVVENEEVEKSQVVLAAQDMVDTIQKMLEDVGQMQVKELPALVSSIESEIGANESQTYNDQASQQLETLNGALKQAFEGMKSALNVVTGQADSTAFDAGAEMGAEAGLEAGADIGAEMGAEAGLEAGADMGAEEEIPEPESTSSVGRAKR